MIVARNENNEYLLPTKDAKGFCPCCWEELVPKMGEKNIHHWSHVNLDCDIWREGETKWHLDWKLRFGIENCEKTFGNHRADIVAGGTVIEVQHSPISTNDFIDRSKFYISKGKKIVWVIDYIEKQKRNFYIEHPVKKEGLNGLVRVIWTRPKFEYLNYLSVFDVDGSVLVPVAFDTFEIYNNKYNTSTMKVEMFCREYSYSEYVKVVTTDSIAEIIDKDSNVAISYIIENLDEIDLKGDPIEYIRSDVPFGISRVADTRYLKLKEDKRAKLK